MKFISSFWNFFQNQILGMKWLNEMIGALLSILGINIETRLGLGIQFFLYDVIKITILLCVLFRIFKAIFGLKKANES